MSYLRPSCRALTPTALLGLLLPALLPAQTSALASNRFVPADSALVLRIASPAKWRSRFARTQVSKLGESEALAPLMRMANRQIEAGLHMLRDSGLFDAELAEGLLNDWMGDIVLSVQIDWDSLADSLQFDVMPSFSLVVALTPDGSFDLGAVQRALDETIEQIKPEHEVLLDFAVGEHDLRRTDNGEDEPNFTMPALVDGALVLLGGSDIDHQAAELLATDDRWQGGDVDDALLAHFDVGGLIRTALASDDGNAPVDLGELFRVLGLQSLRSMTFTVKPDGEAVTGAMRIGLTASDRGLLDVFPQTSEPPSLLAAVPAGCESFSISTVDLGRIYTAIQDAWRLFEDEAPMTFDDALQMFAEATKIRLKEDLLDHLGNELLIVQDAESLESADFSDYEDDPVAMVGGTVYGVALSDGEAFATALDKMLRTRGLHVSRKRESYGNVQVYRLPLAGLIEIEYTVTGDLLLIGLGGDEGSRAMLRGVLDARAAGEGGPEDKIRRHLGALEPGWNGVAVTPISVILNVMANAIETSGELPQDLQMATSLLRGLAQDIRRLGLDSMVSTTRCDEHGITSQFRW